MGGLAKAHDELSAQGVGIAGISVDPPEDSRPLADRLGLGFPLLSDPRAEIIAAYGVQMEGELLAVPATFVVRPDHTIAWQYVGGTVPDRPTTDVVRQEVLRLR